MHINQTLTASVEIRQIKMAEVVCFVDFLGLVHV